MRYEVPAIIVAPSGAFRDALESNLRPPAFRLIAAKEKLSDVSRGELPRSELYLIVIECGKSLGPHTTQIAELKQQNPLARVAIVGQRWTSVEIASAFEAGANAYFAEAAISKEFMQTVNLITR
jgi:DNA-binding NarL/FixJ family response regulator